MTRNLVFDDMLPTEELVERLATRDRVRHEIGHTAGKAQRLAKRSMYALQRRDDQKEAEALLLESAQLLAALEAEYGGQRERVTVGSWRVGAEEFLEGLFFLEFVRGNRLCFGKLPELTLQLSGQNLTLRFEDDEIFGALSDLTGEIHRQMQMWIVNDEHERAVFANRCIAEVCEILNQNSSGGHLRNKVDQANRNLHHSDSRLTDLKLQGLL